MRYVEKIQMNNTSLRERFGLDENYKAQMSRLIKLAVERNLIKSFDLSFRSGLDLEAKLTASFSQKQEV